MNSQAFFDEQFRIGEWQRNNGPAQTRYFMSQIVGALSDPAAAYLRDNALSILDWGCALGDGLDVLKQACPKCSVTGMDFSSEAVGHARSLYPHHEFIHGETIERDFDVIITSNCLEHFDDPLRVVETHLRSCRKLYIALVPFEESPLCDGHVTSFGPDTFPQPLGSWTCVDAQIVDMDPAYWGGWQLLVVYGSMSFLQECDASSDLFDGEERKTAPLATSPSYRDKLAADARKRDLRLKLEEPGEWNAWLDHPMIVEHYGKRALVDGLP